MKSKLWLTNGLLTLALLVAACGGSSPPTGSASPSPASSPAPSLAATGGTKIAVATNAKLGQILVDGNGMTVYLLTGHTGTTSTCGAACVPFWPPVLTTGVPQAGTGAEAALLGTTTRADGKVEVTYAGHPLYYFISDSQAGETGGQGLKAFGGLWWVT